MSRAHIYNQETGLFTGHSLHTDNKDATQLAQFFAANTPEGHSVLIGDVSDYLAQRVDVVTGTVIDYQPPAPSTEHEWNSDSKRWQLSGAARAALEARRVALAGIVNLEASQPRAVREALLGVPDALERLKALDMQIAALRPQLAP